MRTRHVGLSCSELTLAACCSCLARYKAAVCCSVPKLADARPDIFKKLAPGQNIAVLAAKVTLGSARKMWWACAATHSQTSAYLKSMR